MSSRFSYLSRFLPLSLLLVALASVGCGGGSGTGTQTTLSGPVAPLRLLDPSTPIVAHVDMSGLRQSPYYALLRDLLLGSLNGTNRAEMQNVLTLLDRTDHVVIGVDPVANTKLVIGRGSYQANDLDLLQAPEATTLHRQHTLRGDQRALGIITDGTLIIGQPAAVTRALDRLDGLAPATGPTLAGFAEAAGRAGLGQRDVSLVMLLSDEVRSSFGLTGSDLDAGLSAGGSLDLRSGIRLDAFFTASSEGAVRALAQQVRSGLDEAINDGGLAMLGISALLRQVELRERGTELELSFHLNDQQTREAIERFQPLLHTLFAAL